LLGNDLNFYPKNILYNQRTVMYYSLTMSTERSTTSSIGAAWPPIEASNDRLRGFYPEVVATASDADNLAVAFEQSQRATHEHPNATRLSLRAVVEGKLLPTLGEAMQLEAALPIANTPGQYILYAAWNDPARKPTNAALEGHRSLITQAQSRPLVNGEPFAELLSKGFEPRILTPQTSLAKRRNQKDRFLELYSKFDFNEDDVEELLTSPHNTIAYIENDEGKVISTALAERGSVTVGGYATEGILHIAEITEAVTDPAARGRGLYRALSGFLSKCVLEEQRTGQPPLDALYGESNLSSPGVIISAHRNGRKFSMDDASHLGLAHQPHFGILQQSVRVNDGSETRPYNDFALTYIPLS
jgi:hypothetical protein